MLGVGRQQVAQAFAGAAVNLSYYDHIGTLLPAAGTELNLWTGQTPCSAFNLH